ncbi:hypothetical protein ACRALDRAFT_1067419 [Sodiomyces alcalophilus JCM 7366]|uniref:uncharacterized protein n=1 Tax=Sodiomyces alcalophilus JCM 7366 TaxID=591952 RepID=UPI0039B50B87
MCKLSLESRYGNRNHRKTWPAKLRGFLRGEPKDGYTAYHDIYRLSCKEENMSSLLHKIHPDLSFREPTEDEISYLLLLESVGPHTSDVAEQHVKKCGAMMSPVDAAVVQCLRDVLEAAISAALEDWETVDGGPTATTTEAGSALSFSRLPLDIQAYIIRCVFEFPGRLIHCISRLDPFFEPIEHAQPAPRFLNRFHMTRSPCSLTFATKPSKLLAPLGTCKTFFLLGIHAFYGLNTFAFSSLGEFGRFCSGIGPARLQRIQHVELLWAGNQFLCFQGERKTPNGRPRYTSRRTWDLRHLREMQSLKYLVVHISETGKEHVRRGHEPARHVESQALVTKGQPNARKTRSMRTIQGLDYILSLRGMAKVVFYDFERSLKFGGRHVIRD